MRILVPMDIASILRQSNIPREPEQVKLLRAFVQQKYNVTPQISVSEFYITMAVPSAALAGTLRFDEAQIKTDCKLTKKLRIRIGK